ncbi:GPI inositol-deacylase isoform X1 [Drosophila guanche]|uniref:GPI inositol-deacylase n=1 Tax=Drosophila guanche TaxID=7266 RepID=A0A3B0KSD9_DROGU|nr:GPI inositol-deacylase isoform X1 [Drosophila guanche]SPP89629.1 blast:GPI inositol-deacylase [Drosophila guanche]
MFMFRNCAVLLVIGSICCFIYGIINLYVDVEPNACRMTYMFGQPMFSRVRTKNGELFPNYRLFYYYEEVRDPADPLTRRMTGAPVIFVPGNSGSYKQVRSLASVALRKALSNEVGIHLDYYTIDYDEELSALYGGYLHHQRRYLKLCIRTILSLYKVHSEQPSIVLIGHSMGGKLAQSVLTDLNIGQHINTIISISTPLDQPVVNLDAQLNAFYAQTDSALSKTRTATLPTTRTNVCNSLHQKPPNVQNMALQETSAKLDNVLIISTGGGNRDLLVRPGLTTSKYNDLHAMTSAIPRVSLSCDHLSAVWCLQFIQAINGFLFSIAQVRADRSVIFGIEKQRNLQLALSHFMKPTTRPHHTMSLSVANNWNEERRLVINKYFANGLKTSFFELIGLKRHKRYKKLAIETLNADESEWLFGCTAQIHKETGQTYCERATPLIHLVQRLPNREREPRSIAVLDLHNLRNTYLEWTHVLVRIPAGSGHLGYNLDIYDPRERYVDIRLPRWYSFARKVAVNETLQGTLHYRLHISDLFDPYQSLRVIIEPLKCLNPQYRVTARLCVPWAAGFERFQTLTSPEEKPQLYANVPTLLPKYYNTTLNPVTIDLYLDPICRYRISYEYGYSSALSRLVLEFYGWLPAHLACVLLIVLRKKVSTDQEVGSFISLKPYTGFLQYTSLFVVTACRLLKKLILSSRVLPAPEPLDYSINVSILIHCAAIAVTLVAALGTWLALSLYGNAFYCLAMRLTRHSQGSSNILISVMTHLPITYGILTIATAIGTYSGVGLLLAFVFYFLMLSNAYKDYLEDFLWEKAANLVRGTLGEPAATGAGSQETGDILSAMDDGHSDDNKQQQQEDKEEEMEAAQKGNGADSEPCLGLQNFPFHVILLLMLLMQLLLNAPSTLAWVRSRRHGIDLPDPGLQPSIVILVSLSLLLQFRAPQKCSGHWMISILLYVLAGIVLLYCQAAIYRLNFVFAGAFALLSAHQGLLILWHRLA